MNGYVEENLKKERKRKNKLTGIDILKDKAVTCPQNCHHK